MTDGIKVWEPKEPPGAPDNSHVVAAEMAGIIKDLVEVKHQAERDLCGEQREFHLPRLRRVVHKLMMSFPVSTLQAMKQAKDAYGDLIFPEEK